MTTAIARTKFRQNEPEQVRVPKLNRMLRTMELNDVSELDLSTQSNTGSYNGRDVYPHHDIAYFTDWQHDSIKVYDISVSPAVLLQTKTQAGMVRPRNILVQWPYLLVTAQGTSGAGIGHSIFVFDIRDPSAMTLVDEVTTSTLNNPISLQIAGTLLAVSDLAQPVGAVTTPANLVLFDCTDFANITERGTWNPAGTEDVSKFQLDGRFAYVNSDDTFYVIDCEDPDNPVTYSTCAISALFPDYGVADLQVSNGFAYLTDHGVGGFVIIDLTDLAAPVVRGRTLMPTISGAPSYSTTGLWCFGKYLALGDLHNDWLYIYDISNPDAPELVDGIEGPMSPAKMMGQGNQLLIAARGQDAGTPIDGASGMEVVTLNATFLPAVRIGSSRVGWLTVDDLLTVRKAIIDDTLNVGWHFRAGGDVGVGRDLILGPAVFATRERHLRPRAYTYAEVLALTPEVGDSVQVTDMPGGLCWAMWDGTRWLFTSNDRLLEAGHVGISHTGTTSETLIHSFTVPANSMGPNGRLVVDDIIVTCPSSANTKRLRVKFGASFLFNYSITTLGTVSARYHAAVVNRNATNSQLGSPNQQAGYGEAITSPQTAAVDTTADVTVGFYALLSNAGETMVLESFDARVTYGA